jgi:hypothetical protein
MKITKEQIEEYKNLYKRGFDEELTDAEAEEIINRLLILYEVLAKPLPSEQRQRNKAG